MVLTPYKLHADDTLHTRLDAMIGSMTPSERTNPEGICDKRRVRIAQGSGTSAHEVDKFVLTMQSFYRFLDDHS